MPTTWEIRNVIAFKQLGNLLIGYQNNFTKNSHQMNDLYIIQTKHGIFIFKLYLPVRFPVWAEMWTRLFRLPSRGDPSAWRWSQRRILLNTNQMVTLEFGIISLSEMCSVLICNIFS